MNLKFSPCDTAALLEHAAHIGIDHTGVAPAAPVPDSVSSAYRSWIRQGHNASMEYLDRYHEVRRDPRLLMEGTRSVISCAIGYYHPERQPTGVPSIASYAHGDDYHDVVKRMLGQLAMYIRDTWGGTTRVCVDTAPIHERYWAVKAGIATRCDSGLVAVPRLGTYCFLGEILTTVEFLPTPPLSFHETCDRCQGCKRSCPAGAILRDGTIDATRCISYMTIEHRGDFPKGFDPHGRLYGCDTCQQACHLNRDLPPTTHSEFRLREAYKDLSTSRIASMTHEEYIETFRHSAIKRAKLEGLKRNALHIITK
ncbi:MAG: tRNA epoxyqueuosine(34) reductase QueG [Clostridiales bacterium]|nr:tRNA epoxyqueuosine(34) reductase QueG [Clostridiales bacterium]